MKKREKKKKKKNRTQCVGSWSREGFPFNFSSLPRPITGGAVMSGLLWFVRVSCPGREWQAERRAGSLPSPQPHQHCPPLTLTGLCVTRLKQGGNTWAPRRSGAGQFRRAERRGAVRGERDGAHPSTSWRNPHLQTPLWLLETYRYTPPPPFFSLSLGLLWTSTFFFFFPRPDQKL